MTELAAWNNFYVIVGSSAGALIGLQFVVMTLIAASERVRVDTQAGDAFATPSVVHFGAVLLVSAIASAPWEKIDIVMVLFGVSGLGGLIYCVIVIRRMRSQSAYRPVFEDWLFHALLPLAAYASLTVSAIIAWYHLHLSLYLVGASALVFLFVGVHNAWDAVTYHILVQRREQRESAGSHEDMIE